ncbi:MAG: pyridoxamine 5'-phosphate oxidase family protein [Bdellovibrionales bacterium]|nr:pyridoxamine 5'-phosphate oxidase family protein [Bdellovibrionales bacterium]
MQNNEHQKLADIINDIKFAMLTTNDGQGKMHSRPMATLAYDHNNPFAGTLWFFTKKDSLKVHDIEEDKEVLLTYSQSTSQKFVVLSGLAAIEKDKFKMVTLWNPELLEWFPKGIDDPELALIKVEVESADIWDSPPGKVEKIVGIAKSLMTGHPYEEKPAETRHIGLKIY